MDNFAIHFFYCSFNIMTNGSHNLLAPLLRRDFALVELSRLFLVEEWESFRLLDRECSRVFDLSKPGGQRLCIWTRASLHNACFTACSGCNSDDNRNLGNSNLSNTTINQNRADRVMSILLRVHHPPLAKLADDEDDEGYVPGCVNHLCGREFNPIHGNRQESCFTLSKNLVSFIVAWKPFNNNDDHIENSKRAHPIVEFLLGLRNQFPYFAFCSFWRVLLDEAFKAGCLPVIQRLFASLSDLPYVLQAWRDEKTALATTAFGGHIDVLRYLVSVYECFQKKFGSPLFDMGAIHRALGWACRSGHLDFVRELVSLATTFPHLDPAHLFDPASDTNQALINACASGNLELVRYLIEELGSYYPEIDPAACDNMPLVEACTEGRLDVVRYLLSLRSTRFPDIDPTARNNAPFHRALSFGRREVVDFLILLRSEYPNIGPTRERCIEDLCEEGEIGMVELLVKTFSNVPGPWKDDHYDYLLLSRRCNKAFEIACASGDLVMAQRLLEMSSSQSQPIRPDDCGDAALRNAARNGHVHVVEFLLSLHRSGRYPHIRPETLWSHNFLPCVPLCNDSVAMLELIIREHSLFLLRNKPDAFQLRNKPQAQTGLFFLSGDIQLGVLLLDSLPFIVSTNKNTHTIEFLLKLFAARWPDLDPTRKIAKIYEALQVAMNCQAYIMVVYLLDQGILQPSLTQDQWRGLFSKACDVGTCMMTNLLFSYTTQCRGIDPFLVAFPRTQGRHYCSRLLRKLRPAHFASLEESPASPTTTAALFSPFPPPPTPPTTPLATINIRVDSDLFELLAQDGFRPKVGVRGPFDVPAFYRGLRPLFSGSV
jgi:ankyrin repeat protein